MCSLLSPLGSSSWTLNKTFCNLDIARFRHNVSLTYLLAKLVGYFHSDICVCHIACKIKICYFILVKEKDISIVDNPINRSASNSSLNTSTTRKKKHSISITNNSDVNIPIGMYYFKNLLKCTATLKPSLTVVNNFKLYCAWYIDL